MTTPAGINPAIFDAILMPLNTRQAAFVRTYFASGKRAATAARASGFKCGGNRRAGWRGYQASKRQGPIKNAIVAIDRLLTQSLLPGLPAAEVDAALAATPGLRARQAHFVRAYFACGRDASKAMQMAGYADPARGTGRRQLMKKPAVRAAIKAIDDLLARVGDRK
jgi:hypothetical protein